MSPSRKVGAYSHRNLSMARMVLLATLPLLLVSTLVGGNSLSSSCPERGFGYDFRLHQPSERCFKIGEPGPCTGDLVFYNYDNVYGYCRCPHDCGKIKIYWPWDERCYYVNSQGPCGPGEILTWTEEKMSHCTPNPCYSYADRSSDRYVLWFTGKCYETGVIGAPPCDMPFEQLQLAGFLAPKCVDRIICKAFNAPETVCSAGTLPDHLGRCRPARSGFQICPDGRVWDPVFQKCR